MHTFYCLLLLISFGFRQQPNPAPFKISIETEKSTVVTGADVLVDVSLTNTSSQNVEEGVIYRTGIGLDTSFRFEVRDQHGKLVPKRVDPDEQFRTGSIRFRTIPAGRTLTQPQPVSTLYDMRKPGKYTVQVWRPDPVYDIKSNIVTITVTPKEKPSARKAGKVQ
jgi:hypothetical protein